MENNKNWPVYSKDNLVFGSPKSEAVIVTLWTPIKNITEQLDKNLYCLAGHLYSKEGINYIIRNILANPNIHYLIVCGRELSGSGKTLMNFFQKGVNENHNIIGSDFAFIHKELPRTALDLVRKNITVKDLTGVSDPEKIRKELNECQPLNNAFAEPQLFPDHKKEKALTFPSEESVFKVRDKYIGSAWLKILKLILRFGTINKSWYGNEVRELFNITAVVQDEDPFSPKLFPYLQVSEEEIKEYQSNIMKGDRGDEVYTYGERFWNYKGINQVESVIVPYLKKYPNDRAALAVTFDMAHDHNASRSPCMCLVQATTLGNNLNLTAYFRSHAIFSGWVLNAFGLRELQYYIAGQLSKKPGTLTIFSNCAHIYDNEWQAAQDLVEKYGSENLENYPLDPRGYFLITVERKEIVVKLYSLQGQFLQEFRQAGTDEKAAFKMYNKLISDDAVSEISHAFDLGVELHKAEIAIKNNLIYTQDKELIL